MKRWLQFLGWAAVAVVALLVPHVIPGGEIAASAAVVAWIAKLAYEHFDSFNLLVNRVILWSLNGQVEWEMNAIFSGEFDEEDVDRMMEKARVRFPSVKIVQQAEGEATFAMTNLGLVLKASVLEIGHSEGEMQRQFVLAIQRVIVPFRHSARMLNGITDIIENAVRASIHPIDEKYEFKAFFRTSNPYMGLFIRRLRIPRSARLNVEFGDREGVSSGRVAVSPDKLSLVTTDLPSLQALSRKYITLSSLNLSEA